MSAAARPRRSPTTTRASGPTIRSTPLSKHPENHDNAEIPFRNAQLVANDAVDLIPFRQGWLRRR